MYMVTAQNYRVLKQATMRSFLQLANSFGYVRAVHKTDMQVTLGNGAEVLFRSTEDPGSLRGPNLSGLWMDEASLCHRDAFDIGIACLREGGDMGWCAATFTPKGRHHWTYQVFGEAGDSVALYRARTLDNPFLPSEFYDVLRSQYTSTLAAQELEGEFVEIAGGMFERRWFADKIVDELPADARRAVRAWDKAATRKTGNDDPDYSAGALMVAHGGKYYVADMRRGQWSSKDRDDEMKILAELDAMQFGGGLSIWTEQEPGSGGKESAEYTLRMLAGYDVHAERATGDKDTRARPFAAQCEAGNVYLLRGKWNADYLDELCAFPEGLHDDQVDASSLAFNKLARPKQKLFVA